MVSFCSEYNKASRAVACSVEGVDKAQVDALQNIVINTFGVAHSFAGGDTSFSVGFLKGDDALNFLNQAEKVIHIPHPKRVRFELFKAIGELNKIGQEQAV